MAKPIQARLLKGFRDSLPYGAQGERRRRDIIRRLGEWFELGGFEPIDTPALELAEILLGKGGGETEKQIYRFADGGGRQVALRFDLTLPLSRFVVQHAQQLHFPFKCYHIAKVWRGENAQRGRYREFFQCDFDIIGAQSGWADLLVLQMAHKALTELRKNYPALGPMRIHINHRSLLQAFWQIHEVPENAQKLALRAIDKLHKIGPQRLREELETLLGPQKAQALAAFLNLETDLPGSFEEELQRIEKIFGGAIAPPEAQHALAQLRQIADFARQSRIELRFDPSIARGLDYYTGMIFETFLADLPGIGSICSGGRYDELTRLYGKQAMPGVGASIGLDRLLAALEQLEQQYSGQNRAPLQKSCVISLEPGWNLSVEQEVQAAFCCFELSHRLQNKHIACDLLPRTKKIENLFQRAEWRNCGYLVLLKPQFCWQLRDLQQRKSQVFNSASELCDFLEAAQP